MTVEAGVWGLPEVPRQALIRCSTNSSARQGHGPSATGGLVVAEGEPRRLRLIALGFFTAVLRRSDA